MKLGSTLPATVLLALAACAPETAAPHPIAGADAARGRAAILEVGCASCHDIPGVAWPKGKVGPALEGFASRALIAGRHPNRPEILVEFVRNAPAYAPNAGMPAMPLSERQARDVAAYLYTLDDD